MILVEYDKFKSNWYFRSVGKILPNSLCDFASGSKVFNTAFLALRHAKSVNVSVDNAHRQYHTDWLD